MIGTIVGGKYEIRALLGKGGMGSVYEAAHTGTGRRCALKVISSEGLTKDPNIVSRFQREARAAGAIDTQYIAQVLDADVDKETNLPFLVVEFLDGEDLQHLLKRTGPISPELAMRIGAQVCLGLQKAHDANVVHRDIKPANLFLTHRDAGEIVVKMLDFGIAKVKMDQAHSTEGSELTRTGNLLGSPMYMSPEQARGQRGIDHRTDLYSLGAVLYQALSGRTPFQHATALGELILFVCSEPPPPLQDQAPWVPPEVAAVVHRCLVKNPAERYQNASEMFDALQALLPNGWAIHKDMLVGIEDAARQPVAARLPMSIPPPAGPSSLSSEAIAIVPAAITTGDVPATTGGAGAMVATQPDARAPAKSRVPLIAGVSVLVVAVAAGVWAVGRGGGAPATSSAAPTTAPTTDPTVTATASAAPTSPPATDDKVRRVRVVIMPKDANVEVDGKPAKVKDGILELSGAPGSVFEVRVFKGNSEAAGPVAVTETGALPPLIELQAGKVVKIKPTGVATAEPGATGAPPPVPKGIDENQDEFK